MNSDRFGAMEADELMRCRRRLMAVAYGMPGTVRGAGDVVQDACLRLSHPDKLSTERTIVWEQ